MKLSIIVVSYNSKDLTLQALEAAWASVKTDSTLAKETEVYVVDSGSDDGSRAALAKWAQKNTNFHLINMKKNLGFGAANNAALEKAGGDYLLFLNPDTQALDDAIPQLVAIMDQYPIDDTTGMVSSYHGKLDRLGLLSAGLYNADGSWQAQGGSFPTLLSLASHMLMLDDLPILGKLLPSTQQTGKRSLLPTADLFQQEWVGATALLARRQMVEEIGGFDQNIFLYGEDVELCMRAKRHLWDVAIYKPARVIHLEHGSTSSSTARIGELKGYQYIWAKHKPLWQRDLVNGLLWVGCQARILLFGTILQDRIRADIYRQALKEL